MRATGLFERFLGVGSLLEECPPGNDYVFVGVLAAFAESVRSDHLVFESLFELSRFLGGVAEHCVQVKFLKFLEVALGHVDDEFA